jgi:hypothetical protein
MDFYSLLEKCEGGGEELKSRLKLFREKKKKFTHFLVIFELMGFY